MGLQQVCSGRVLQREVPFHRVREGRVKDQSASEIEEEGRYEEAEEEE